MEQNHTFSNTNYMFQHTQINRTFLCYYTSNTRGSSLSKILTIFQISIFSPIFLKFHISACKIPFIYCNSVIQVTTIRVKAICVGFVSKLYHMVKTSCELMIWLHSLLHSATFFIQFFGCLCLNIALWC